MRARGGARHDCFRPLATLELAIASATIQHSDGAAGPSKRFGTADAIVDSRSVGAIELVTLQSRGSVAPRECSSRREGYARGG